MASVLVSLAFFCTILLGHSCHLTYFVLSYPLLCCVFFDADRVFCSIELSSSGAQHNFHLIAHAPLHFPHHTLSRSGVCRLSLIKNYLEISFRLHLYIMRVIIEINKPQRMWRRAVRVQKETDCGSITSTSIHHDRVYWLRAASLHAFEQK